MQKKNVLITIFPFQLSLNIRFDSTVTFEIVYQGKSLPVFDKKNLINGKANVYDTFTPTLQCMYNKNTQRFASNDLKLVLTLHTSMRETNLGQFSVQLSKILNKKQKLRFDFSNGLDRNSFVQIGMMARFTDIEPMFQSSMSRNFIQTPSSYLRPYESSDSFQKINKRTYSYDKYLYNPQVKDQRLTQKDGSKHMSSRSKYPLESSRKSLDERISNFGDSKRNFRQINTSEQERQKQSLQNENRQLKRKSRQMQNELESMRSKRKSLEAQVEREKRKQASKDLTRQQQSRRLNLKLNEKQNQLKQYKTDLDKKASEYAQAMRQSQKTSIQSARRYEGEITKLNKRLQKAQEKQKQSLKTIENLESRLNSLSRESKLSKISYEQKCLQIAQSKQQNKKLSSRIQNAQLQRCYLQQQVTQLQQDKDQLFSQCRLLAQENLSLKKNIQTHAYSSLQAKELIHEFKNNLNQTEQQLLQLKKQKQQKQRTFQDLTLKYEQLSKQLQKRNKLIEELAEINSKDDNKIKDMLKDMKMQHDQKQKQITSYRQALKKKEEKIESLYKDNLTKENVLVKRDKLNDELKSQIDSMKITIKQLKQQILRLQDEYWRQTIKTQALNDKQLALSNQLSQIKKQFQQTLSQLQDLNQAKESQINQLQQKLSQVNEQLLNERQNLQDVNAQLEHIKSNVIPQFEKKVQELQQVQIQRYKALIKQQMLKITSKNKQILSSQSAIKGLRVEAEQSKIQILRLRSTIDTRKRQFEQYSRLVTQKYQQQIRGLKDENNETKRHLEQEKQFYTDQIRKLQAILKQKDSSIQQKSKHLSEAQTKLNQVQNLCQQTNEQLQTLQQTIVKLNFDYELLEKKKKKIKIHYEKLLQDGEQYNLEVMRKLKQSLEIQHQNLDFALQLIKEILQETSQFSLHICNSISLSGSAILRQYLINFNQDKYHEQPQQTNQSILKSINQLTSSLQQHLKNHLKTINAIAQSQTHQILTLNTEKLQLQQQNESLDQLISELNQHLFDSQKTIQKLTAQSSNLQKQLQSYKEQTETINKQLLKTQNISHSMKSLHQHLTHTLESKQTQIESQSKTIDQLKTQLQNLKQSHHQLEIKLKNKNQQLNKNLQLLQQQLKSHQKQLQIIKTQNSTLSATNSTLSATNSTLSATNSTLQNSLNTLQARLKSSKQQNQSLAEKLAISQKSFKSIELLTQTKIQQILLEKQKISFQFSELDKKSKASELQKKTKLARLNSYLETLTKQNEAYIQQIKTDKSTLLKIQQATIELDKMIISLEKDNRISLTLAMPLKNILKKNEGIINVNIKSINALTVALKVTSPASRVSKVQIEQSKTRYEEKKKAQVKRAVKVQTKGSLKKSQDMSSASRNENRLEQFNETEVNKKEEIMGLMTESIE